jgi:hypothetical protein
MHTGRQPYRLDAAEAVDALRWSRPYAAISTGLSPGERLFFPVQLDGRRIIAVIETGSQLTALSTTAARALGLSDTLLAEDRSTTIQGATAGVLTSRVHRFAKLEVGTIVVRNPEIIVTDLKLGDADLVSGVDLLRSRRLWLSYGSRRIFVANP